MEINFKPVPGVIRVDLNAHGFGPLYVLIVPDPETHHRTYYMMHNSYGVILYMFGSCQEETDQEAAELAYWNAPDYIPEFVKLCFTEDE